MAESLLVDTKCPEAIKLKHLFLVFQTRSHKVKEFTDTAGLRSLVFANAHCSANRTLKLH